MTDNSAVGYTSIRTYKLLKVRKIYAVRIHPKDNVATLCEDAEKGDVIYFDDLVIELLQGGKLGDKIALLKLQSGDKVIKYNAVIGSCTQSVAIGEWVHKHNLESDYMCSDGNEEARHG